MDEKEGGIYRMHCLTQWALIIEIQYVYKTVKGRHIGSWYFDIFNNEYLVPTPKLNLGHFVNISIF